MDWVPRKIWAMEGELVGAIQGLDTKTNRMILSCIGFSTSTYTSPFCIQAEK